MTFLVIGAGGQLGTELVRLPRLQGRLVAATRSGQLSDGVRCEKLDVSDPEAVRRIIVHHRPRVVINASAYTAVDRAEGEVDAANAVNADAPAEMARACASVGARFVHYSTDYVFDGAAGQPYVEEHPAFPAGAYGHSKLAGERAVRDLVDDHLILRTAWVYAAHGHNFMRTMLRLARDREELSVVADQIGSPTPAWLIARETLRLLEGGEHRGTVHLVAQGVTSWHGFATAIFEGALERGLISRLPRVRPITTAEYPTPAARPAYSVLDSARALGWGAVLPHWREALDATLDSMSADG